VVKSTLLRGILLISLCSVIFLPMYTFFFLYPSFDRLLTDRTEEEAAYFASHLASRLLPGKTELSKDLITPAFKQAIEQSVKDMHLEKVKVFAPSGEIIYSTDAKDIGEMNRKKYFFEIVARGISFTQVVKKSSPSLEGKIMTRDVVETYVPLKDGEQFNGAFELYYDITKSREKLDRLVSVSSAIVFIVAVGLLLGVVISALKAHRSIQSRDRAEEELRKHQDDLEKLVKERSQEIVLAHDKIEKEKIEKEQVESSLQNTEAKYRSLVESTEDSIYLVDRDHRYLFINKKHLARMGLGGEYVGQLYSKFHSPEETGKFTEHVDRVFKTGESCQSEHQSNRDGRYFLQTLSPIKDQDGNIAAITVISKDISDRKRMEEELRALSLTDQLTGLYNRRGFMTFADQYVKITNRMKSSISMLYADLDGLKAINDAFGHNEGDAALTELAEVLRETFRESDIVARIGGDEFVVMPVALGRATVEVAIERLIKKVAEVNAGEKRKYRLSISYGIAFYDPAAPCSIEELLSRGDRMMYENKKSKKDRG
jgi:diguanylate cyclase (GGDEF)-like protein/PAS domain S-box-containing protein